MRLGDLTRAVATAGHDLSSAMHRIAGQR